ncbi:methyltransferase [uncultured Shewanella sp.]|uniref:class I SAM-dependent methyltransferase n=1 Tax=uncultured Shewanella sp. TaxID=173975 RepID=UPI002622BCCC|nr:methyltransferase [uncultured Shewanella sp.]
MKKISGLLACIIFATTTGPAFANLEPSTALALDAILESPKRSKEDSVRDHNRLPKETLAFLGFNEHMKVLELMPGKGWYSQILAGVLKDKGTLYTAIRTGGIEKRQANIEQDFGPFQILNVEAQRRVVDFTPIYEVPKFSLQVEPLDMILTFRNYHNLSLTSREHVNKAAFSALKPGGVYAIVDHTRRHMEADNSENRRRVDPIQVIKDVQASGFVFSDYSKVHFRAEDELKYEVGDKNVTGKSDRFTLKFVKPVY